MSTGDPVRRRALRASRFTLALIAIVGLGAVVRLLYLAVDDRSLVGGEGLIYHLEALRFGDGHPFTTALGGGGQPTAHHPPAWPLVLGVASWLGARSLSAHQAIGVGIGLLGIYVIGLVGRRYFNARVGLFAATIAALYPGFWVLEAQVMPEPLAVLVLGLAMLAFLDLRSRPSGRTAAKAGLACGVLALVLSELVALFALVVVPTVLLLATLTPRRKVKLVAVAAAVMVATILPWTVYASSRVIDPVYLSTGGATTFLAGNCPPATYEGERLGYQDNACLRRLAIQHPEHDRSQISGLARATAIDNMVDDIGELPRVAVARAGRALGLFRPSQTVDLVAQSFSSPRGPIWLWFASFLLLVPFAISGYRRARAKTALLLPLLAPVALSTAMILVVYGDPRFHAPADLGVIVLAAVAVETRLVRRGTIARRAYATRRTALPPSYHLPL